MRKWRLGFLAVLLLAASAFSQDWTGQGRQIGYVTDEEGKALQGVKVKLFFVKTQTGFETETDTDGKWVAIGIKGGTWYVDFEMPGYLTKKIIIQVKDYRAKNPQVDVKLTKAEGLVVTDEVKEDFLKGNKLFEEGNYGEAIGVYEGILVKFPDAYVIYLNIGNSYFQLEKYDEAEKAFQKVLEKDPQNVNALLGVGNCYVNRGDSEKALEWYSKIEFEKIDDPTVLYNVGTILRDHGKSAEALNYYRKAVELQEDFLDARYQLATVYLGLGNNPEALREFETYLKFDPDSERASQVRGFIEYLKKQ
jgi:tetratricopeptide (TPR) repeat protein